MNSHQNNQSRVFDQLAQAIQQGHVGFFFGAGTSIQAGIPPAASIVDRVVASLGLPRESAQRIKDLHYPFEAFLELLGMHASLDGMLQVFKRGLPTQFHWLTKKLVDEKLVVQLMTTNFDLLIEKTNVANLCILCDEREFLSLSPKKVNYIKVHGGINEIGTIRTVMGSIAQKKLREKRKKAIEFFFDKAGLKTIFVFGYSCSDKVDITPYIKSIKNKNSRIVFIQHDPEDAVVQTEMPEGSPFKTFQNTLCIRCNTDRLIQHLSACFNVPEACKRKRWECGRYFDYGNLSVYKKHLFAALLLSRNGCHGEAAALLRKALLGGGRKTEWAEIISLVFEVYHNLQIQTKQDIHAILPPTSTYSTLKKEKEKALEIFCRTSNRNLRLDRIGRLKTHWGHLLLSFGKYDEAILSYREALDCFTEVSNAYRIYQSRNNLANTFFTRWKNGDTSMSKDAVFEACYAEWQSCLRYFKQSRYLFEYEIACENMVELLMEFKGTQKKRIEDYLEEAKKWSEYLNDGTGIDNCDALSKAINKAPSILAGN